MKGGTGQKSSGPVCFINRIKKLSEPWNLLYLIYYEQSWYHHVIWMGLIDQCNAQVRGVVTPYSCTQKVHGLKSLPGHKQYQGSLCISTAPPSICQDSTLIRTWPLTFSSLPIHNLSYSLMLHVDRCFKIMNHKKAITTYHNTASVPPT